MTDLLTVALPQGAQTAIQCLEAAGHTAYAVGGCVRDACMGRAVTDWDLATSATPEEMLEVFADFRIIPTGLRHGTLTVFVEKTKLEITTYRCDGEYVDHRRPVQVTFSRNVHEDLARRDFTINAMAYRSGEWLDPCGGAADIDARIVRCVGDPHQRFEEDALRIMRGLRFAATLGFEIEEKTAMAMREKAFLLSKIAKERVMAELCKLICGPDAARVLIGFFDVLRVVLPEVEGVTDGGANALDEGLHDPSADETTTPGRTTNEPARQEVVASDPNADVAALPENNMPIQKIAAAWNRLTELEKSGGFALPAPLQDTLPALEPRADAPPQETLLAAEPYVDAPSQETLPAELRMYAPSQEPLPAIELHVVAPPQDTLLVPELRTDVSPQDALPASEPRMDALPQEVLPTSEPHTEALQQDSLLAPELRMAALLWFAPAPKDTLRRLKCSKAFARRVITALEAKSFPCGKPTRRAVLDALRAYGPQGVREILALQAAVAQSPRHAAGAITLNPCHAAAAVATGQSRAAEACASSRSYAAEAAAPSLRPAAGAVASSQSRALEVFAPDSRYAAFWRECVALMASGACYDIKSLAINGGDVLQVAALSGTGIGAALEAALTAVMEGRIENRRADLLNWLKAYVARTAMGAKPGQAPDLSANQGFLPTTRQEMDALGWDFCDFVVVSGDAYVDHPSFAAAVIARLLLAEGFRVGILPQPDWRASHAVTSAANPSAHDAALAAASAANAARDAAFAANPFPYAASTTNPFLELGKPRLAWMIAPGNLDSMVNHYTTAHRRRSSDAYAPGGQMGLRPDRAGLVYANLCRKAAPEVPIILGGMEASLRRFAHYDYWEDRVRASWLLDSGADLLVFGMGERALRQIGRALCEGTTLRGIRGTCAMLSREAVPENAVWLPSFEQVAADKKTFAHAFALAYREQDAVAGRPLAQPHGTRVLVQYPPALPLAPKELDAVYEMPYVRRWHPRYDAVDGVPALEEIQFSVTATRGCFGNCSFCSLTFHQGRQVVGRTHESVIREIEMLTHLPGFKGYIHDVGGPTANFRKNPCAKMGKQGACSDKICCGYEKCRAYVPDHDDLLALLRKARAVPGVKKVFLRSGLRYDAIVYDKNPIFLDELAAHHVSGQLKVAPEHVNDTVLRLMGKPPRALYDQFAVRYGQACHKAGLEQYLVPYYMSAHPGSDLAAAIELAQYMRRSNIRPEQVQDFYPTPGTRATCMYYTGLDPLTMQPVYVERDPRGKAMQRALLQATRPQNYELVKAALIKAGREDLIGYGKNCLIPPRQNVEKANQQNAGRVEGQDSERARGGRKDAKGANPRENPNRGARPPRKPRR